MKLPAAQNAVVSREKVADYLLNPAHPDNGGKAEFFTQLGFHRDQWEALATALKTLVATGAVTNVAESAHGKKYIVVGRIQSSAGKSSMVRTIWIVDKGQDAVRLVTAYPRKD